MELISTLDCRRYTPNTEKVELSVLPPFRFVFFGRVVFLWYAAGPVSQRLTKTSQLPNSGSRTRNQCELTKLEHSRKVQSKKSLTVTHVHRFVSLQFHKKLQKPEEGMCVCLMCCLEFDQIEELLVRFPRFSFSYQI